MKQTPIEGGGDAIKMYRVEIPDYLQRAIAESLERGKQHAAAERARIAALPWWKRWLA